MRLTQWEKLLSLSISLSSFSSVEGSLHRDKRTEEIKKDLLVTAESHVAWFTLPAVSGVISDFGRDRDKEQGVREGRELYHTTDVAESISNKERYIPRSAGTSGAREARSDLVDICWPGNRSMEGTSIPVGSVLLCPGKRPRKYIHTNTQGLT